MSAPTLILAPVRESNLSTVDQSLLTELEAKVENSWLDCCYALAKIRDYEGGRLWNQEYKTFNEYVYSRFNYSSQHALRQVAAGEFILALENAGSGAPPPRRESQVRPIIQKLPERHRVECWEQICEKHPGEDIKAVVVEAEVVQFKKRIPKEELIGTRKAGKPKGVKPDATEAARQRCERLFHRLEEATQPLPRHQEIIRLLKPVLRLIKRSCENPTN